MQLSSADLVSDAQNLAQVAGTYLSDKSIDLQSGQGTADGGLPAAGAFGTDYLGGAVPSDPGKSLLRFLAQVVQTFTSAGAATLQVNLVSADDAALTTNLTVLSSTAVLAKATLVAGYKFLITGRLPPGITQRFVGLQYVIGTATTTAGKVTAGIAIDEQTS